MKTGSPQMYCGRPPWALVYLREAIKDISALLKVKYKFRVCTGPFVIGLLNRSFSSTRTVPAGLSTGTSWCEDGVETAQICPGRYLDLTDPEQVRQHALEGVDARSVTAVQPGDMIVAATNFGCGAAASTPLWL